MNKKTCNSTALVLIFFGMCMLGMIIGCNESAKPNLEQTYVINEKETCYCISLHQVDANKFTIISQICDIKNPTNICEWPLDFPVFRFERGDIDANGTTDILVGVIKKTRFDSTLGKRIFIFKVVEGFIRPLWLGSRVAQPLEDFSVVEHEGATMIRTIEKEKNGNYLVADYKWKSFGIKFVKYHIRDCNLLTAKRLLTS